MRKLPDGTMEIGAVRLDPAARSVQFSGTVNMAGGLVEYLVVHSSGKVHESVLRTEVRPMHIHLAALLLADGTAATRPAYSQASPAVIPPATVWVSWRTGQGERRVRAEELLYNLKTKAPATTGEWTYTGSRLVGSTFIAERDGSILAVYTDPDALLNNPRPGRDDDEIWQINTNLVALVGAPVRVEMVFAKPAR